MARYETQHWPANPSAPGGKAVWELPLAVNLPAGRYTLAVVDIPTGAKSSRSLSIR